MTASTFSALVLGSTDLGEADRLVHMLTREQGRVSARARGVRRSKKRYGGRLDRYSLIRAAITFRKGKGTMGEVDLLRPFLGIRDDLLRTAQADHLLELLRLVTREEEPCPSLFGLSVRALGVLDEGPTPSVAWLLALVVQVLGHAGLAPQFDQCALCGKIALGPGAGFSAPEGGVLCGDHAANGRHSCDPASQPIGRQDLVFLRRLPSLDLADPAGSSLDPVRAKRWRHTIWRFTEYHLERELRTRSFLDGLL